MMRVRFWALGVLIAIMAAFMTMGAILVGVGGIVEAEKYKQPVVLNYDEFARRKPDHGWYRIKGCVLDVADATGQTTRIVRTKRKTLLELTEEGRKTHDADTQNGKKTGETAEENDGGKNSEPGKSSDKSEEGKETLDKLYVPVHNAADPDDETIPLLLETSDSNYLDTYREMEKMNEADTQKLLEYIEKNEARMNVRKDLEGMVSLPYFSDEKTKLEVTRLNPALTADYRVIEERTPSLLGGIGALVFGLMLAGGQLLIYRSLLRAKPHPTMADPSMASPYNQSGPNSYTPYAHADENKRGWTPTKWR